MGFTTAVTSGFRNYANFKGRASRSEYWWWALFSLLVQAGSSSFSEGVGGIASLALLLPSVAVAVRRMHDTNRRGWWILVPIVNLVFALTKSEINGNRFGQPYGYVEPAAPETAVAPTERMPPPAPTPSNLGHQAQKSDRKIDTYEKFLAVQQGFEDKYTRLSAEAGAVLTLLRENPNRPDAKSLKDEHESLTKQIQKLQISETNFKVENKEFAERYAHEGIFLRRGHNLIKQGEVAYEEALARRRR